MVQFYQESRACKWIIGRKENSYQSRTASAPRSARIAGTARPMPLGIERHHPGGMTENSPAFQRRDKGVEASSPEGTLEMACFSRPFGTYILRTLNPALKRWAIFTCPFGTQTAFVTSIPSGIGRAVPNSACKPAGGVWTDLS